CALQVVCSCSEERALTARATQEDRMCVLDLPTNGASLLFTPLLPLDCSERDPDGDMAEGEEQGFSCGHLVTAVAGVRQKYPQTPTMAHVGAYDATFNVPTLSNVSEAISAAAGGGDAAPGE
ncbi:hypothetical protein KIPB_014271, partial [Kipferlia bialata]